MSNLVVVDTSVFIEYLRGDADDTLSVLTLKNKVLLSPVVRLELLAGVRKKELHSVIKLCNALRPIEQFASVEECEKLLERARGSGLFGGIPDLLIIADAIRHRAHLFSYDEKMRSLGKRLGAKLVNA
ncbi:MAG: PIN domain-containing protein [Deltaproteobacteria bacterium]|nr:PIN domain-containing protein [Deltaproteobacteria bacterium]